MERGADLHTAQLMPLPLTVSWFSKIQIGFTFLVLDHLGSPGKKAVKRVCVCVCISAHYGSTMPFKTGNKHTADDIKIKNVSNLLYLLNKPLGMNQTTRYASQHHSVPVPGQDKLGGLRQIGHSA